MRCRLTKACMNESSLSTKQRNCCQKIMNGRASIVNCIDMSQLCVAGAIKGDHGPDTSCWFCAVATKAKQEFSSTEDARNFFRERIPRVLELTSEEKIAAFAKRTCYHIGQTLTCSQLHGGKAVLLGDAAAAFPPIGQAVNAAMESAMVLDLCIDEAGSSPTQLLEAAKLYNANEQPLTWPLALA